VTIHDYDRMFSQLIRARANWICARCQKSFAFDRPLLQCSHFHSRRLKSVRFDPENAEALCWRCHHHLDAHPQEHVGWKRQRLGEERFEALRVRAQRIGKVDLIEIRDALEMLAIECGLAGGI
jgi:5-methylcytosine-specific restriction endonuclease McrA